MFKIPDWEDDVPKSHIELSKKNKKHKVTTAPKPELKVKIINKISGQLQAKTETDKTINNLRKKSNKQKKRNNTKSFSDEKANSNRKLNVQKLSNIKNNSNNTQEKNLNQMKKKKCINYVTHPVKMKHNDISKEQTNNNGNIKNAKKRKISESDDTDSDRIEDDNFDLDKIDEVMLNAKKRKLNKAFKDDDREDVLFSEIKNKSRSVCIRKEKLKKLFEKFGSQSNRNSVQASGNKLRERMLERLNAAKFRFLNEKLYTSSGSEAQQLFQSDPAAFQTYHQGYQQQLKKWPVNPLDVIVKQILKMSKSHIIADMGCGEAALSKRVPHTVRSFDLVATGPGVEACDMAHTPLLAASVDVAVYCLALMGTDLTQYLVEANRVLRDGGHLLIAEVESRFGDTDAFTRDIQKLGFKLKNMDKRHEVFFFFDFIKVQPAPIKKSKLPALSLKPCLYKKR